MFSTPRKRFVILALSIAGFFITGWLEFFLFKRQYLSNQDTNRIALFLLINLHVITILILLYLIIRQSIKLFVEIHRKYPGSNFKRNLLFAFSIFSVVPSIMVFFIAGKLITASIDENYLSIQRQNFAELEIKDYKKFKPTRNPVYWSYLFTFILVTLLILFLSIWCAFYLAKGISKPIQELLKATERIRRGEKNVQISSDATSDLQGLAIGFNQMTKALQFAQSQLEQKNKEMLMIIENIKEAVFFINRFGRILTYNTASKVLVEKYLNLTRFKNKRINFFGPKVTKTFIKLVRELVENKKTQLTREINFSFKSDQKNFLVHLTYIKNSFLKTHINDPEDGILVVIEDLTDIVKINKIKTWQEAAKQMAHEIKNPLTPIMLATQRLQRKYKNHLEKEKVFLECTNTVLNHVKIIKDLVSHFSEFSQLPASKIEPLDLNEIINEVVFLYKISYPEIKFIYDLQKFMPFIKIDKKKIKRVIVNLMDNSVRILKQPNNDKIIPAYLPLKRAEEEKFIKIKTSFKTGLNQIELLISDNGPGIPRTVKNKLFLPYVSGEKKNMGLGLAIVHEIVTQTGGNIKLLDSQQGAVFQILLPV
ncbi:HAMP domain-containing protein [Candidatus Dependentiae bacterium]|nr:HAMP domain-containing protein [Candidatus Dependentiae bacterium]